jgi:sterol desaturase/sphingolipid hydroxylase (fatty acid hydroxylase superfamily)
MVDILELVTLGMIPAFLLLALAVDARPFERPSFWRTRMLIATVAVVGASMGIAAFWGTLLDGYSLLDGSMMATWPGAGMGILTYEFLHYWYHRCAHRYDALWRLAHQMHHSAEAMDAFSANYLHPMDVVMFTSLGQPDVLSRCSA